MRKILINLVISIFLLNACSSVESQNLLFLKVPSQSQDIISPHLMTDGRYAFEGSFWKGEESSVFEKDSSFVVYDLGDTRWIKKIHFQADNNDEFLFSVSFDGINWSPLWRAPKYPVAGLHQRWISGLNIQGRYLKLGIISGDGAFSVSELQVFGY